VGKRAGRDCRLVDPRTGISGDAGPSAFLTAFWAAARFAEVFRAREGTGGGTLTGGAGLLSVGVPTVVSFRSNQKQTKAYMAQTTMPSPQAD
jgi:hypothetical protein